MKIWRICKQRFAKTAFSGEGAKRVGGRWNSRGMPVAYCSENLSLAALELLVHIEIQDNPPDLVAIPALIPEELEVEILTPEELPEDWRRVDGHGELKAQGDSWMTSEATAVLQVPSVVIPEEANVLLNPNHPEFTEVDIGIPKEFSFDDRLVD